MINPLWLVLAAAALLACAVFLWRLQDPRDVASERGYNFKRTDESLAEEWRRGAAASGSVPRDVMSAIIDGREVYMANIGSVKVVAMRRPVASDIVLDFRTFDSDSDLIHVREYGDFQLYSNNVAVADRAVDSRMLEALEMPAEAIWAESDWVLAQYDEVEPETLFGPLALFADAACALPAQSRPLQTIYPTRAYLPQELPEPETVEPTPLQRIDPVQLPSRHQSRGFGVVEPRAVGVDEITPIGERFAKPETDGTRILRKYTSPTIFPEGKNENS